MATSDIFTAKLRRVQASAHVDFGLYGMLGQDNDQEIAKMAALGALGLKLFMGQTTGDNPLPRRRCHLCRVAPGKRSRAGGRRPCGERQAIAFTGYGAA